MPGLHVRDRIEGLGQADQGVGAELFVLVRLGTGKGRREEGGRQ
jgi:hypothetical protein